MEVIRMNELASTSDRPGKLPVAAPTIWRWVQEGRFPVPFRLGGQTTVWDLAEVDAWLAAQAVNRVSGNPAKSLGGGRKSKPAPPAGAGVAAV